MMAPDDRNTPVLSSDEAWSTREDRQAAAYDGIGERYDEAFPHKGAQIESARGLISRLEPGSRVLDVGCGTGLPTTRQLVDAGMRTRGVDISPVMLDIARRNVPEADFAHVDMVDLDGADDVYDAVVAYFSLLHLPRARMSEALAMIRKRLVPGGWLSLSMVEADLDDVPIPFLGNQIRVTGYFRDELRGLLADAGFSIEEEGAVSYAPVSTQADPEIQLFLLCRRVG